MHTRSIKSFGILLIVGMAFGSISTPVEAQGFLGVSAGVYKPESSGQDRTGVYGLRGGYRFNPGFGLEGSLNRVDLADTSTYIIPFLGFVQQRLDHLYNLDLSLQGYPGGGSFLVFGGIGGSRLNSTRRDEIFGFQSVFFTTSYIFTAHAGLAYDWQIGNRVSIRPEARVRRYFGADQKTLTPGAYRATDYEAGLTFGWRFGS